LFVVEKWCKILPLNYSRFNGSQAVRRKLRLFSDRWTILPVHMIPLLQIRNRRQSVTHSTRWYSIYEENGRLHFPRDKTNVSQSQTATTGFFSLVRGASLKIRHYVRPLVRRAFDRVQVRRSGGLVVVQLLICLVRAQLLDGEPDAQLSAILALASSPLEISPQT
jgi:hypothetical protein